MASAEQLLSEIRSQSLQQVLLLSLRQPPFKTGIPALDDHLSHNSPKCLRAGDVIHIQGPTGTGKSHLLYFLVTSCILPLSNLGRDLGGWGKVTFVLDMDGTFDVVRLKDILLDRLQTAGFAPTSTTTLIQKCLENVHIFRPSSTGQLAITLAYLPKYYLKHFPNASLGLVAIHSIDAFYWLDRFKAETLDISTSKVYQNVTSMLQIIRQRYGIISIITHWGLPQSAKVNHSNLPIPQSQFERIPRHLESLPITVQITLAPMLSISENRSITVQATVVSDRDDTRPTLLLVINKFGLLPE
ncbi:hypothetical protein CPB83DRAFT_54450 [Crepidotus variabilis]|uniref:RecA family profile 1 domain-containing protein n=1 Tax=Crepidotus variabilis TaxID=179855 RepID=A0A9P6EN96_9AGAR|nr:hypothetical protein CPB83DRAFT_54450 [Crepidotus variabilis]